jgi:tetratricopeptide (TPR) repeat protein
MSPEAQRTSDFLNQILIYNRYSNLLSHFEKEVVLTALCSFYLERYKITESYYEILLSNPSSAPGLIHFLRGFNLEYLNRATDAVNSYDSSINTNSFPDEVFLRKGIAQFDQSDYQKAIRSFSSFIERNHSTRHALRARANAFVRIAKYDSAIIDYTSFIKLDSSQLDIYTARALCFKTLENYSAAIADYSYIVKRNFYDVESVGLLSVCMYLSGDTIGAYNQLNKTFNDLRYLSETGYYLRGTINLLKKQYDTAVQDFNKVILLNPQNIDALIYRGLANYSLEQYTLSKSDLQSAIKLDKDEVTALYTLGLVNIKLNDLEGAYDNLHKAELLGHPLAKRAINAYLKNYQIHKDT